MNQLNTAKRTQIIAALIEGNSINATCRMLGVGKHTVLRLLEDAGCVCAAYHDANVRNLRVTRAQCDEVWSFVYAKQKNVTMERMQLTTDGHRVYADAVEDAFGSEIDYAMLVKIYGASNDGESRYSPATCIGCRTGVLSGNPDPKHISTSYVERQNLSMRMGMRRFTRLTNGFSKKFENHAHQVALYFMHYNFCRVHTTLRVTPAMETGLTDHVWTLAELCGLLPERKPMHVRIRNSC